MLVDGCDQPRIAPEETLSREIADRRTVSSMQDIAREDDACILLIDSAVSHAYIALPDSDWCQQNGYDAMGLSRVLAPRSATRREKS